MIVRVGEPQPGCLNVCLSHLHRCLRAANHDADDDLLMVRLSFSE